MRNNLFVIAKNGWSYVGISFLLFAFFAFIDSDLLAFIFFGATLLFLYIFRNPERELPVFEDNSILSPVDGAVNSIVELDDSEYAYRVDIESNYLDVSILRAPMHAKIKSLNLQHGTRVSSMSKLFSDTNEKAEIVFIDKNGNQMKVVHTLKQSFSPLILNVIPSQQVHQTARYGFMNNGITSIYLPQNVRINVNVTNELKASESLLGYFS